MQQFKVFISSVQKEFATERQALYEHFKTDALLSAFFEPVLFEHVSANSHAPNKVYLDEVKQSQVYLMLLGKDYGYEDEFGVSPTEMEYRQAQAFHLDCLAFIKGESNFVRHEKEEALINKIQYDLSYKRFETLEQLITEVNSAFVTLLKYKGLIQLTSFDESIHPTATISDLDTVKIKNFVSIAQAQRGFPIKQGSPVKTILAHLHLIIGTKVCNSALLAFAKDPQLFFPAAITKCAHFHGFRVEKPIPDHKVFQGDVFEQVDQAVDFVLSKISASVGMRDRSNKAPIKYEIPRAVVAETIVNAVAHRIYTSSGSVQVMLFKDRLEVSNPGSLNPELSIEKLKEDHASYPTNPRLAETMYQAGYIERFGTGTGEIFRLTSEAGLREPEFDLEEGFKVTIWRPLSTDTGQGSVQASVQADNEQTYTGQGIEPNIEQNTVQASVQATGQADNEQTYTGQGIEPNIEQNTVQASVQATGQATGQASLQVTTDQLIEQNTGQVRVQEATGQATGQVSPQGDIYQTIERENGQVSDQVSEGIKRVLLVFYKEMKSSDIQNALQLKHRETFKANYLNPAIIQGFVQMTIREKPNSPNQKYRLTKKGKAVRDELLSHISTNNQVKEEYIVYYANHHTD